MYVTGTVSICASRGVAGRKFSSTTMRLGARTRKCGSAVTINAKVCSGVVTSIFESMIPLPLRFISPRLSTRPVRRDCPQHERRVRPA